MPFLINSSFDLRVLLYRYRSFLKNMLMPFIEQASLKPFNSFSIQETCNHLITVNTVDELIEAMRSPLAGSCNPLVLGSGSNILLTQHYEGLVILNRIKGIEISEDKEFYYIEANGGEDWPAFVEWSVTSGIAGIENLALIPGCVGSAPIQNIGAYGIELKDICDYVEYLDTQTFELKRLSKQECAFSYRDSIFKRELKNRAIITQVGFKLPKAWIPTISYGGLKELVGDNPSSRDVFQQVCAIRMQKLPDPAITGNAGSFFKNPVINQKQFTKLKENHPTMPFYRVDGGIKLAAGWLIDNAGLKGHRIGGAMVHKNQALVIVNHQQATASDIVSLAKYIQSVVRDKYSVSLEPEVRFIGATDEVYLDEC